MKRKGFKLFLSGMAVTATAISLTASTFAFVVIGNNVVVSDFNFNVSGYEGLNISLDGVNFAQDITSDQLKEKVAGSVTEFDAMKLQGVTLNQDTNHKILYPYTSLKGEAGTYAGFSYDSVDVETRTHSFKEARVNKDYIAFDLWFKAINTETNHTKYNLVFGETTNISAKSEDIELHNKFSVGLTEYKAGDKVTQNVANAMRLGVYSDAMTIFEVTNSEDLGSAAIEGATDDKHKKENNIMYQYYNTLFPLYPFESAAEDGEAFNTKSAFGSGTGDNYTGELVTNIDLTKSDVEKVTIYIWLEGWDADYLPGTTANASKLNVDLDFVLLAV